MNLYNLHSEPESLNFYEKVSETNPDVFLDRYKDNKEELKKREKHIAKSAVYAFRYVRDVLKAPFPLGETVIAKNAEFSYYAMEVLKGPFPLCEATIAKDGQLAYYYADSILKGPFPAGEEAIAKSAEHSYYFAAGNGPFRMLSA